MTGYGAPVPGTATEATLRKLREASTRPAAVPAAAAFIVLLALAGPFGSVLARLHSQPAVNSEGTNYASSAFGAVGVALAALVLVPLGIAMLVAAWAVITQRTWGWYAAAAVFVIAAGMSITGAIPAVLIRIILLAACGVAGFLWFRPETRKWFGVG